MSSYDSFSIKIRIEDLHITCLIDFNWHYLHGTLPCFNIISMNSLKSIAPLAFLSTFLIISLRSSSDGLNPCVLITCNNISCDKSAISMPYNWRQTYSMKNFYPPCTSIVNSKQLHQLILIKYRVLNFSSSNTFDANCSLV